MTEQARRTYQHMVAALEHEAQQDEAVQAASCKTEDSVIQQIESRGLEFSSCDNKLKLRDNDAT